MRNRTIPERVIEPPEDIYTVAGGCGHEVYRGEALVEWHNGRKYVFLCEECFRDRLNELTTGELAHAFGCDCRTVVAGGLR